MAPVLRLFEDSLSGGASLGLPPLPRMIFVVHGAVTIDGKAFGDGEAWSGEGAVSLAPGKDGTTVWRYEMAPQAGATGGVNGAGVRSREKLSAELETIPPGELLLRGDSVAFPPGGCAFLQKHLGPGPWYETGSDPVFAQAAMDRPSRFIRVMVLPRSLLGKSSFQFVNEADKAKPRVQQYKIFADMPIGMPTG